MNDRHANETELELRLRAWLHADAAGASVPAPLRDRVNAIPAATPDRGLSWLRFGSPTLIPAVVVTVVIAIALSAIGLGLVRPFLGTPPDETATVEELDAAVTSAIAALRDAPGVQGVEVGYIDEYLSQAAWFDSRPNGDVAVVQRVDVDVAQTAWWLNPTDGPPAVGRTIATAVRILAGDAFYQAALLNGEPENGWSVAGRDAAPRGPLATGLLLLAGEDRMFGFSTDDGEVTREEAIDGGTIWTLTTPDRDGHAVQRWHIRPGGELAFWSSELVGVTRPFDPYANPATSGRIDFTLLADPDPISAPDAEIDPDPSDFDLPEDFPLGSD